MNYPDGQAVRVGDVVLLGDNPGVVVCSIDDGVYPADYPKADWMYLREGVLIDVQGVGLVHYATSEAGLRLQRRAAGRWPSVPLGLVLRTAISVALGFGAYWMAEQMLLRSGVASLEQAAVWLSPISIFGWIAIAVFIAAWALIIRRLWPRRPGG